MVLLLQYTLIFASVLMLVALGGCFAERSGVINIGLEGIMVIGALGGALVMKFLPVAVGAPVMVITTILAAALFGMLFSLLLAVAAISFKADQTITGTAMNMLATAGATVAVKAMNTAASGGNDVSSDISYVHSKDLFLVRLGDFEFSWFMLVAVICLVVSYVLLYKTKFGLRLRACGEHPQAADSVGINVYQMRYAGVLISGLLGGLDPIGSILSAFFIQYITLGGGNVDLQVYCSQISSLISSLIIYLCAFVIFFKAFMQKRIAKGEEKKAAAAKAAENKEGGEG